VNFVAAVVGEFAYSRTRELSAADRRRPGLGRQSDDAARSRHGNILQRFEQIEKLSVVQWGIEPFRWFVNMVTARAIWPDFVKWAGICFAVNAVLVAVIYLLDVRFMKPRRPPASAATPVATAPQRRIDRRRVGQVGQREIQPADAAVAGRGGADRVAATHRGDPRVRSLTVLLIIHYRQRTRPGIASGMDENADMVLPWVLSGWRLFMSVLMGQFYATTFAPTSTAWKSSSAAPRAVAGRGRPIDHPRTVRERFQILLVASFTRCWA